LKNKTLIILALLALGCLAVVFSTSQTMRRSKTELDQERYNRMLAEERLEQATIKIKSLESNVSASMNQLQSTKDALGQQRINTDSLKAELERMTKLKEALEQELKNSLVTTAPAATPPQGQ